MIVKRLPCLLLAGLFAVPLVVADAEAVGRYTLAGPPLGSGEVCVPGCGIEGGPNLGYDVFPANGLVPVFVRIEDASGFPAPFTACQDLNGDGTCILGEEPWLAACGEGALEGFVPDVELRVVVKVQFLWSCEGELGTTGTIHVTYASDGR